MRKCDDVDDDETGEIMYNFSCYYLIFVSNSSHGVMSIISIVDISTNRKR